MVTEKEYFTQWVEQFKALIMKEGSELMDKFSIEADRDERGCVIPYMATAADVQKEDKEALTRLWKKFLLSNPY